MSRRQRDEDQHGKSWQTRHIEHIRELGEKCITGEVFSRSDAMTTTCGPLYQAGLESFTGMHPEKIRIFAAGFVSGQAEKIYLAAVSAAMFRPSEPWLSIVTAVATEVAARYGLFVEPLQTSRGVEVWMCQSPAVAHSIRMLPTLGENSPRWHERRGLLCGIPAHQIDVEFHKRAGFGEPCDVPMTETI